MFAVYGAYEVGFKIGTGLNEKFLKIGIPGPNSLWSGTSQWSPTHSYTVNVIGKDQLLFPGAFYDLGDRRAWEIGFVVRNLSMGFGSEFKSYTWTGTSKCRVEPYLPMPEQSGFTTFNEQFNYGFAQGPCEDPRDGVKYYAAGQYAPFYQLVTTPVQDYTGQPFCDSCAVGAPPNVPDSELEASVKAALTEKSDEYRVLLDWLEAQLGGETEDPTGQVVKVPDCLGLSRTACQVALDAVGLDGEFVEAGTFDFTYGFGEGIWSAPAPGAKVDWGTTVRVTVNPDHFSMPDCFGMPSGACVDILRATRLNSVTVREERDPERWDFGVDPDYVVGQSPAAGSPITSFGTGVSVSLNPSAQTMNPPTPKSPIFDPPGQPCSVNGTGGTGQQRSYPGAQDAYADANYQTVMTFPKMPDPAGPTAVARASTIALLEGYAAPKIQNGAVIGIGGFGLRHIRSRHGWGPEDIRDTAAALLTPPQPTANPGIYVYRGPAYTDLRTLHRCARIVVVYTQPNKLESPQQLNRGPKQIYTSYGGVI